MRRDRGRIMSSEYGTLQQRSCPHETGSRSAAQPAQNNPERVIRIDSFAGAREVLRSADVRQAGFNAELVARFIGGPHTPVLYQDGEPHQRQRSATARFFAPR